MNTTDAIHESIQSNLRRECLIIVKCLLRTAIREIERAYGQDGNSAAIDVYRAYAAVEKFQREVQP